MLATIVIAASPRTAYACPTEPTWQVSHLSMASYISPRASRLMSLITQLIRLTHLCLLLASFQTL
jgi:hypothetical protein